MAISDDIAALTTATNSLLAAVNVSKNTLDTTISNASAATVASAQIAALTVGTYPNAAATTIPQGVQSFTSLVGGSGGTNGTFSATITGGAGTGATATFVVSGGALTSITITNAGTGYTSVPTIAFTASSGLTGASATLVIGTLVPNTRYYWASTTDGAYIELYQNNAGTPLKVSPTVAIPSKIQLEKLQSISAPLSTYAALAAITSLTAGMRASVLSADAGTHTDPVVGGTVSNAGVYSYSTSPAGWQRVADLDSQTAQRLGAEQVALATAEVNRAEVAADLSEAARDDVTDTRDTIVAAAGLTPTRAAVPPTMMFDSMGTSYIDLPDYSNEPAPGGVDWLMIVEGLADALGGDGTTPVLISAGTGGNNRSLSCGGVGAPSNQRLLLPSAMPIAGVNLLRNLTYRAGAGSLWLGPLERFVTVIACIDGTPHFAAIRSDGVYVASKGDSNWLATGSWYFGGTQTALTINRVSNELVISHANGIFGAYTVGKDSVYVPGVGARVVTWKAGDSKSIKCVDVGPDAADISTTMYSPSSNFRTTYRVFSRAGVDGSGVNPWRGGICRLLNRWGTTVPGEFASLVDGDGFIKQSWLKSIIDGTYKTLPGQDRSTLNFGAAIIGSGVAYTGGSPAAQPTITGTMRKAVGVDQPSWLRVKAGQNLHNRVHAQEIDQPFGSVEVVFQSDAMPFGATVTIYDRDPREAGAVVVVAEQPLFGGAQTDPTNIVALIHKVPANSTYWGRAKLAQASPEVGGNSNYYVDFPCPVGPVETDIQQSLTGAAMAIFAGYNSATVSAGLAAIAGNWSGGNSGAGNAPGGASTAGLTPPNARSTNARISSATIWPDQYKHWANVFLDAAQATDGRPGACMFMPLVRSGHNQYDMVNDGQSIDVVVGTATAGVAFSMAAFPQPFARINNKWTEPSTIEVLVGNTVIARDDYANRTGSTAPWTNGFSGSWNYDNWAASTITIPYGGTIRVRARASMPTTAADGSLRLNYNSQVNGLGYTLFGRDGVPGSGNLIDNIMQTTGVTAVINTWLYYLIFGFTSGKSDADVKAEIKDGLDLMRARLLRYPQFANRRTGKPVPTFLSPEQRIVVGGTAQLGQQRGRYFQERIASESDGRYIFAPGCLTCPIEAATGAHNDGLGAIQLFQQKALVLASYMGRNTNEHHIVRRVIGGVRLSANSIKLFITPNRFGIGQHDAAATAFAGLWYSATNDPYAVAYVDTSGWTYSIDASLTQPSITLTSPSAIAGGYFDLNRCAAVPSTAGTKAVQDGLLKQTLCVLNGDYHASLTRRGDDIHYSDTLAGIPIA